jgi:hypothetical protein
MSNDHYVAQTYLPAFRRTARGCCTSTGRPMVSTGGGALRASVTNGMGDLIRDFVKDENLLGTYRGMFEPRWNDAITDLENGVCDAAVKMAIAGYWANLLVCTPAWTRLGIKMHDHNAMQTVRAHDILLTEAGKPDAKLKEMLAERADISGDAIIGIVAATRGCPHGEDYGKGGGGTGKVEEQPHALRNYLTTQRAHPSA